ncbi:MAG: site-specific DNA-methyltransferase [Peptococcaceae bacterium]|nr:site-specific DNA-methyltransferase [Peptococcaceae bacterium]
MEPREPTIFVPLFETFIDEEKGNNFTVYVGSSANLANLNKESSYIITGDALMALKQLPEESIQTCITSPPYWGLRDYGIPNQIGTEMDITEYLMKLIEVFREVKRVLKSDGTFWLNIGDGYTSGGRTYRAPDKKTDNGCVVRGLPFRPPTPVGLKPKDLLGLPWRLAFKLQEDGWYLRADIIWYKPNALPESVKDRPTIAHEYLFLLSKSEHYYYDYQSILESAASGKGLRNKRSVWAVNTEPYPEAHFATFPTALITPCILAGSRQKDYVLDPFFGSGTTGLVALKYKRNFIGIELNKEFCTMAEKRLAPFAKIIRL